MAKIETVRFFRIMPFKQYLKKTKVWKSVFRHDFSDTPRTRLLRVFGNVFLNLHPVRIAKDAIRVTYTWGQGGLSFYLFLVLTGIWFIVHTGMQATARRVAEGEEKVSLAEAEEDGGPTAA